MKYNCEKHYGSQQMFQDATSIGNNKDLSKYIKREKEL